jgi:hypothetical protein
MNPGRAYRGWGTSATRNNAGNQLAMVSSSAGGLADLPLPQPTAAKRGPKTAYLPERIRRSMKGSGLVSPARPGRHSSTFRHGHRVTVAHLLRN